MSSTLFDWREGGLRLLVVIGFHIMGLALLIHYGAAQSALNLAPPIMVSIIAPPAEQPIELPKPLPIKRIIKEPPKKIITAEAAKPTEFVAQPPEEKPQPAPVIAEAIIIPPKFNADYLDNPKLQAVERWKFIPARQGAQAVVASVIVPVSFILEK